MDIQQMKEIADGIRANVEKVIVGKSHVIELVLAAMLAEGHVLLEDGKNDDGKGIGEVH